MVKITQKNDCKITLRLTAQSGEETLPLDLRAVEGITVSIPGAPQGGYSWEVDTLGRLVLDIDGPAFSIREYSIMVMGMMLGRDWCYTRKGLFEIVRWTDDSNVYEDITLDVTVPAPPMGYGESLISATAIDIDDWLDLDEPDENVLYVVTQEDGE